MLVQEELVSKLAQHLTAGAFIYLSSDSNRVILWMVHKFLLKKLFKLVKADEIRETLPRHAFILPSSSSSTREHQPLRAVTESGEGPETVEEGGEEDEEEGEEEDGGGDQEEESNEIHRLDDYWIDYDPLAELSERELICEVDWRRVKRCVLVRCD
jgi:hypothetical protein